MHHPWWEHRDSAERAAFNKFKRLFRKAHPTMKRNTKYYETVKAAYKAQGNTLDLWIRPAHITPLDRHGVLETPHEAD